MMKTLVTINGFICLAVSALVVSTGLVDLKKWYIWLFGVYGFLTFFFIGLIETENINSSLELGAFFAFMIMFGGAIMRWNRELAKKILQGHNRNRKKK